MSTVKRVRPRPVLDKVEGTIEVRGSGYGIDQEERSVIEVTPFVSEPAYVRVNVGLTEAMGTKFEFVRVDVGITMPCYPEEVNEVVERVAEQASLLLQEEINRWKGV